MNILEFANPMAWWWAALALPIIALYILKVRLRRQRVSTFKFWDQVFDEKKPRAWWQQLRHWVSLLLQLALLLLLVGALVDPLWSWQKDEQRKLVIILDNSASMAGASESGSKRLDDAKQTAKSLIRSLRVGDEMAVLTAGGKPAVAIGLTDHVRSLLDAVDRVALTDAPTALAESVTTAKRLVPSDAKSRVYVLTDGCDPATAELLKDESLSFYGFGKATNNLAITEFQARRSLLDAIGYQVLVEVANLGDEPQKCELDLTLESQLVDVIPIELEPGASKTLNLDQASSSGGRLVATLNSKDALEVDNTAMAVLPVRRQMPVTLVTEGSLFLRSVLESIPLVDLTIAESFPTPLPSPAPGSAAPNSAALAIDRVLILHQQVPEQLPPGKLFVINPKSNCDLWTVGENIEQALVSNVKKDSPITQHVRLTNVVFPEARDLTFQVEAETLIGTQLDEPLLTRIQRPSGDVLVLNLNLDQGDLPLRIAFPVLMKNAVEWFQGVRPELQPSVSTGKSATLDLPANALSVPKQSSPEPNTASSDKVSDADAADPTGESGLAVVRSGARQAAQGDLWLRDPTGTLTPLAHDDKQATIALLTHCGLWTIGSKEDLAADPWKPVAAKAAIGSGANAAPRSATKEAAGDAAQDSAKDPAPSAVYPARSRGLEERLVRVASNLSNRDESDLRPRVDLPRAGEIGLLGVGGWSIWFYLTIAALVLVAVEWWLYQRRVVG